MQLIQGQGRFEADYTSTPIREYFLSQPKATIFSSLLKRQNKMMGSNMI
jgi:hypothetical protein